MRGKYQISNKLKDTLHWAVNLYFPELVVRLMKKVHTSVILHI